jgi:HPt (histidine-containing phosphotransfer) domain-containing protein
MDDICVIDPQSIENLRALNPGDDDEFLREIAGIFFEDTPLRIAELDQCLASGDLPKFTRAAHSIKGSSSNLGAMALRLAAEKLEHQARVQGLVAVDALLAAVKMEFGRAQAELTSMIAK